MGAFIPPIPGVAEDGSSSPDAAAAPLADQAPQMGMPQSDAVAGYITALMQSEEPLDMIAAQFQHDPRVTEAARVAKEALRTVAYAIEASAGMGVPDESIPGPG